MATKRIRQTELTAYLNETYTARELADKADVSTQYAYLILGGYTPSAEVLNDLGIEIVYEVSK